MVLISNTVRSVFTTITTNASRNVFGNIPLDIPNNMIGCAYPNYCRGVNPYNPFLPIDYSGNTISIQLSTCQLNAIKQIHDMYSIMLSSRTYDKIPANYEQYMCLLSVLETIPFSDSTIKLLLNIVEKTLIGCMNVHTMYQNSMYNSLQILLLNNQIDDILNNKNTKNVIADKGNISGQFTVQQTFKLSKFYSYYIYLYGMPEFGVGFDPVKLVFLKKSLELFEQSHIQVPEVLFVPDASCACVCTDVSSAHILQVVYEIGYTTNLYEHLAHYAIKYPLGYFISSMIGFDASNTITSVHLNFPLNDKDCSDCSSNFSLIDGFGHDSSMTCLLQIGISNEHLNVYHALNDILAVNTFTCSHCNCSFFHHDLSGNRDSAHIPIDLSAAMFDLSGVWFDRSGFWRASGAWDSSGILNYLGVWDSSAVVNSWVIDLLAPSYYLRPKTEPIVCQYCLPCIPVDTSLCIISHDISINNTYGSLAVIDTSYGYHAFQYILSQLPCDNLKTGFYSRDNGYYTYRLSNESTIHRSFRHAKHLFGGDLTFYFYKSYQTETKQFTIMDMSGNIYHTKFYGDILL